METRQQAEHVARFGAVVGYISHYRVLQISARVRSAIAAAYFSSALRLDPQ